MRKHKTKTAEEYAEIFEQQMQEGQPIYNSKGEELILQDEEQFRQCYDEKDPARKDLPKSWFVSNHGNVISTYRGRLEWLMKDTHVKHRDSYHFYVNGKIKIICDYALVALVFESPRFGTAEKLLEEESLYAFGNYKDEDNVQTHHIIPKKKNKELINDPTNLEIMTCRAHKIAHSIPAEFATPEEKQKFMQRFGEVMDQECPHSIVIAIRDGDSCKLVQTQTVIFKKELFDFIREYMKNFKKSLEYIMSLD